jgi:hypothetical protein
MNSKDRKITEYKNHEYDRIKNNRMDFPFLPQRISVWYSQKLMGFPPTYNQMMPMFPRIIFCFIVTMILRWTVCIDFFDFNDLAFFPHFSTPLIDMREVNESIHTFGQTGKFYNSPTQIG